MLLMVRMADWGEMPGSYTITSIFNSLAAYVSVPGLTVLWTLHGHNGAPPGRPACPINIVNMTHCYFVQRMYVSRMSASNRISIKEGGLLSSLKQAYKQDPKHTQCVS